MPSIKRLLIVAGSAGIASHSPSTRRQPVWVYTNQAQVELFVNARFAGSQVVQNRTARWQVELAAGENRIVARAGTLEDATTITFEDRTFIGICRRRSQADASCHSRNRR